MQAIAGEYIDLDTIFNKVEEFKKETADIMHSTEVSQDDIDSFFK